jgi:4-hydroxybenzoate polyprenyltransferase
MFATTFLALIIVRMTVESSLGDFGEHSFSSYFFEFTHTFLFFFCSFLIILPLVRFAGITDIKRAANALLFGLIVIIAPPIIDTFIFGNSGFWSFYSFDSLQGLGGRFLTLFGDKLDIGITLGVRIEIVVTSILLGIYSYVKSKKLIRSCLISIAIYSILFLLGTFPSWITFAVLTFEKPLLSIGATDIASLFLSPQRIYTHDILDFRNVLNIKMSILYGVLATVLSLLTFRNALPKYFTAFWKNARLPQVIWHGGLFLLGMGLALTFTDETIAIDLFHVFGAILILIAIESAWLASVVTNDLYDIRIDAKTNPGRPLITNTIPPDFYKWIGILLFVISIVFSGIMSFAAALLLVGYQALAWIYSAPPFRLKRFPIIATIIAAAAGILVLLAGFLMVSPEHNVSAIPSSIIAFLFFSYAITIPIKDFKDIEGDRADHVYTVPVLLGVTKAKLLFGSLIFLCYFASPFVLSAPSLRIPALLFGSLSFWALQRGTTNETSLFSYHRLPGTIIALVTVYGAMITLMLF